MRKTLTAGLTALSLVLIPAAPVQADSNDETRVLLGLLAVGAIGLAIANNNNNDNRSSISIQKTDNRISRSEQYRRDQLRLEQRRLEERRREHLAQTQRNQRQLRNTRRADPLPHNCFRQIGLNNGRTQSVFTSRCLDRQYRHASSLPRECLTRLGGREGNRLGYSASCLNDRGYRSDRRR